MKFTPNLADGMSGSLGSLVASRNRSGPYFRRKAIPVNPNTVRQQAVRSYFGTLVQYWTATLTAAQRALWNDYASNTPLPAVPSGTTIVTGQNMFVRSNLVRLQIGESIITAAPTMYNTGEPVTGIETLLSVTAGNLGVTATAYSTKLLIPGLASADGDACLWLGTTINATRSYYKGPYQYVGKIAVTATDADADFEQLFSTAANDNGNPAEDQYRAIRTRVMYDDGRLSQPYDAIALVELDAV